MVRLIRLCVFLIAAALPLAAEAQYWARTYGGDDLDELRSVQQTSDGGFIVAGRSHSFGPRAQDLWVLKLDSRGEVEWEKEYSFPAGSVANSVRQTAEGGYIVVGEAGGVTTPAGLWVLKLTATGDLSFERYYRGLGAQEGERVEQTSDGGYIIAGRTGPLASWALLVKLRNTLAIEWQRWIPSGSVALALDLAGDGGYIVAGGLGSADDLLVLKADAAGALEWQGVYDNAPGTEIVRSVASTSDGGYVVAGTSGGSNWQVLKLDAQGAIEWRKVYSNGRFIDPIKIIQTRDDGYALAGDTDGNIVLLRLDAAGNILWQRVYGGNEVDQAWAIEEVAPSGFIIVGSTHSAVTSYDGWVLRVDDSGGIDPACPFIADGDVVAVDAPGTVTPMSSWEESDLQPTSLSPDVVDTAAVVEEQCALLAVVFGTLEAEQTDAGVRILWTTLSEVETMGFVVYRVGPEGDEELACGFVPAHGPYLLYEALDRSVAGDGFRYIIEEITFSGPGDRSPAVAVSGGPRRGGRQRALRPPAP